MLQEAQMKIEAQKNEKEAKRIAKQQQRKEKEPSSS